MVGGPFRFFRPPWGDEEGGSSNNNKTSPQTSKERNAESNPVIIKQLIYEFVGKTGTDISRFTLGEVLAIIRAREEEIQINRACSAQSSELLPDRLKKSNKNAKSVNSHIKAQFEY